MKMVPQAFDGTIHKTQHECLAYEAKMAHVRIVGLTIEQVEAVLSGDDPDLADALEAVGTRIARARRERGDLRRQRASKSLTLLDVVNALEGCEETSGSTTTVMAPDAAAEQEYQPGDFADFAPSEVA